MTPPQSDYDKRTEAAGEEAAKKYARELGGWPSALTMAGVNGHTRGWNDAIAHARATPHAEAVEFKPGDRVLVYGGASHDYWFDGDEGIVSRMWDDSLGEKKGFVRVHIPERRCEKLFHPYQLRLRAAGEGKGGEDA